MADYESGIWVPPGGSADPRPERPEQPPADDPGAQAPSAEEIADQLRRVRASDVVLSLLPTLAQVAYAKLEPETRDLAEARVAIDAIAALVRVLEQAVAADLTRDFQQLVANLQVAYAAAAGEREQEATPGNG